MSKVQNGNKTHDTAVTVAEGVRQAAVTAATVQSAAKTAEIAAYRTMLASAIANGCATNTFVNALRELGTGGS